jgi:LuxR family maltose regulon positive regulatory protein
LGREGRGIEDIISPGAAFFLRRFSTRRVVASDLLATKLHRPSIPPGQIPRPHILRRLQEGLAAGHTLTLFSAPAGFGKTTCAGEWLNALDRPAAWLTLEPADDDPGRFFLYLIAALQQVNPAIGREIDGVLRAGSLPSAEIILTTISNDILDLDQPFLLVMDDFQVIQDALILKVMEQLTAGPPPPVHLALLTREDPPLPLARLRANNRLTEIRAADLRLTPEEAARFLNESMGLSLPAVDIAALEERTEGWIVGLQLAGLSIHGRKDPSAFIAGLSGGHRHILGYLTEEVFNRQTDETRKFLLQTSILDRLSGELCDAVTGRADGRSTLERLYRANLFLVPLDDEGRWYRYHPLFAEMLHDRRGALPSETTAELHRRACAWFIREGMIEEAVTHALAAGDYAAAMRQIEAHAMDMIMQWHVKTVDGWMRSIPPEWLAQSIRANLALAWIHMFRGEHALAMPHLQRLPLLFGESKTREKNDPSLNAKWLAIQAMMRSAQGKAADAAALCRRALELAPEEDSEVRCITWLGLAGASEQLDDRAGAEDAYQQIIRTGREEGNSVYELLGISALALKAIKQGRLHFAFDLASAGIDHMERSGVLHPVSTAVYGELGTVCYQWHQLDEAHRHFQRAIQVSRLAGFSDPQLYYGIILSRLHQMEGNLEAAEREIRRSADLMRVEAAVVVREEVIAQQVRMLLALNRPAEAEALLQAEGFSFADGFSAPEPPPGRPFEVLFTAALRILLHRASGGGKEGLSSGLELADRLIGEAARRELVSFKLELLLLRAQLHAAQGDSAATRADYLAALTLGEGEGYISMFVEEGAPVAGALAGLVREKALATVSSDYVGKILAAFSSPRESAAAGTAALVAQLSGRELEVLRLMAEGLRYEEVAERLVISLNTVRSHVKTIYGKLGVNNRTRAIEIAQRMDVL